MQTEMLTKLHESHQGVVKSKQRAKTIMFWPGMNGQIEDMMAKCSLCACVIIGTACEWSELLVVFPFLRCFRMPTCVQFCVVVWDSILELVCMLILIVRNTEDCLMEFQKFASDKLQMN